MLRHLKRMKRMICRHSYMWSERRQVDVCYHCGRVRPVADPDVAFPTGSADEALSSGRRHEADRA